MQWPHDYVLSCFSCTGQYALECDRKDERHTVEEKKSQHRKIHVTQLRCGDQRTMIEKAGVPQIFYFKRALKQIRIWVKISHLITDIRFFVVGVKQKKKTHKKTHFLSYLQQYLSIQIVLRYLPPSQYKIQNSTATCILRNNVAVIVEKLSTVCFVDCIYFCMCNVIQFQYAIFYRMT